MYTRYILSCRRSQMTLEEQQMTVNVPQTMVNEFETRKGYIELGLDDSSDEEWVSRVGSSPAVRKRLNPGLVRAKKPLKVSKKHGIGSKVLDLEGPLEKKRKIGETTSEEGFHVVEVITPQRIQDDPSDFSDSFFSRDDGVIVTRNPVTGAGFIDI